MTLSSKNGSWMKNKSGENTNFNNSFNGKVSQDYITQYPQFLKPNKHYPHRRTDDSHIKNAMEVALERYEDDLLKQEKMKEKNKHNLQEAIEKDVK
jgi:hypothetical protein